MITIRPIRASVVAAALLATGLPPAVVAAAADGNAAAAAAVSGLASSPGELTETSRLADRRSLVVGDRAYAMSTADSLYPAAGWHIRGEMGGVWSPPIKLVDGIWFRLTDKWLGDPDGARRRRRRRLGLHQVRRIEPVDRVTVERTDFVPDGIRATLVGLTLTAPQRRTVPVALDAHSELMSAYPWGWTTPNAGTFNLPDTGAYDRGALCSGRRHPARRERSAHDWAALVAGKPHAPAPMSSGRTTAGPQDPAVVCPADGPAPPTCDDGAYGKGTGGQLRWQVQLDRERADHAVVRGGRVGQGRRRPPAPSSRRRWPTRRAHWRQKVASRERLAAHTRVDLPGDPLLEQSIAWSKQNLADSVQEVHDLQLRAGEGGPRVSRPGGHAGEARWLGAGWPDYPWIFGTDGEYTAFASVAMGQFADIKAHLRALRDVSVVINGDSGKVVHEVMPDGSVYFGTLDSAGNTDETAKFPSAVALVWRWTGDDAFRDEMYDFAVRNMRYVVGSWTRTATAGPRVSATWSGRHGRGEAGQHRLHDPRPARPGRHGARTGDRATAEWATERAAAMEGVRAGWWYGGDTAPVRRLDRRPGEPGNDKPRSSSGTGSA